jgi:hypothetical protein
MQVGTSAHEKFKSFFQDENPMSGLNWLYLAIVLLKALFLGARTFFSVKT